MVNNAKDGTLYMVMRVLLFAVLLGGILQPRASMAQTVNTGDSGSIIIPVVNNSTAPFQGVTVVVSTVPSWLQIQSFSLLGPVDIYPGYTYSFEIDYVVGNTFDPNNAAVNISAQVAIATAASVRFNNFTWYFSSLDGLKTSKSICIDGSGTLCGDQLAPDTTPPQTSVNFVWSNFTDNSGNFFITAHTFVVLIATDPVVPNAFTSGVSTIAYAIDQTVASFSQLAPYNGSFLINEGVHTLNYASKDNAGNIEPTHTIALKVDDHAPISSMTILGPQFVDASSRTFVSTSSLISLGAQDPIAVKET